ncbi:F-box protein At1g47056-like isoform X3 [Punica granatum]|uniref:F-box protein At1g47056-like isoform X3 n=1 Tax=Punica granatum TaxID=22663 RepID=A0A6P8BZY1_PUNGR|nr:F-box protein At1g47056-like isoform X3 [Punica granatum]
MGQNASASRFKIQPTALIPLIGAKEGNGQSEEVGPEPSDCTSDLPDECLALIFESLGPNDRRQCSLVCRRWLRIEGQSHHRLSLNANSGLLPSIPSLFERFDAVTRLTLTCDRRSTSIGDDALVTISVSCSNLRRVKLLACRNLTHRGMEAFAKNCRGLKKFSCSQCTFAAKGVNAILDNCASLEELSVKRLRSLTDETVFDLIGPGVVGDSLRTIFLKELYNGPSFYPLIIGSKNLRTLRLMKCSGDWDRMLQAITERVPGMVGIHLERIQGKQHW